MAKGGPIDGPGITAATIGGILVYAGIRGYSVLAVIQNLVTGKPITTNVSVTNPLKTPGTTPAEGSGYSMPTSPQAIGRTLAANMGWEGSEWTALQELWTKESGWNPHAKNPSSGAYGIPQALPYSKMPKAAWPEDKGGQSDASAQISWGLSYIKGRYGSPRMALSAWNKRSPHWY